MAVVTVAGVVAAVAGVVAAVVGVVEAVAGLVAAVAGVVAAVAGTRRVAAGWQAAAAGSEDRDGCHYWQAAVAAGSSDPSLLQPLSAVVAVADPSCLCCCWRLIAAGH